MLLSSLLKLLWCGIFLIFNFCRWLGPKRGLGLAGVFYFGGVSGFHRQFLSFPVLRYTTTTTLVAVVALSVGR